MRNFPLGTLALSLLFAAACNSASDAPEAPAADSITAAAAPMTSDTTTQGKINSAMSAGPSNIASMAAIMDFDASGNMVELRPGTNGWMCMPDLAASPGPDPMCADNRWQDWFGAYMGKTTPTISGVGVAYMLQGGSDASNTDPFATAPAAGNDWITTGPHIMVIAPNPTLLDAYGSDAGAVPWVMWKGTPYAHLMVPVGGAM